MAVWLAGACSVAFAAGGGGEDEAATHWPELALFGDAWTFLAIVAALLAALFVWLRRRSPPDGP